MSTTDTALSEPSTPAEASRYQQLRSHLATLRLPAAAEALPSVLDTARAEGLGLTAALERLLRIEVDATEATPPRWTSPVRLPAVTGVVGRLRL